MLLTGFLDALPHINFFTIPYRHVLAYADTGNYITSFFFTSTYRTRTKSAPIAYYSI